MPALTLAESHKQLRDQLALMRVNFALALALVKDPKTARDGLDYLRDVKAAIDQADEVIADLAAST